MKQYLKLKILTLAILLGGVATSCDFNDDNEDTVVIVISEERAAEIVAASLAYNTYGMASNVYYVSHEISQYLHCDEQGTNSGTLYYTSPFGYVTSIYDYNDSFSKDCAPEEEVSYTTSADHDVDAVYFTTSQGVSAHFTVTGIETSVPYENYSGSYQSLGDWYSKVYEDSLDVNYQMSFTHLKVDKITYFITSGTSEFTLDVTYSETSESATFNGSVTFLNEDFAEIDFDDGSAFLLNLETGDIVSN